MTFRPAFANNRESKVPLTKAYNANGILRFQNLASILAATMTSRISFGGVAITKGVGPRFDRTIKSREASPPRAVRPHIRPNIDGFGPFGAITNRHTR